MGAQLDGHLFKMKGVSVSRKGHQMVAALAFSPKIELKTRKATREAVGNELGAYVAL